MSEYIERSAAEERLFHMAEVANSAYDGLYNSQIVMLAQNVIHMLPAADVRPVVLCRDCTHCRKGEASLECEKHAYAWNNMRRWVDEDDFCSWGVKKKEAGEQECGKS